MSERRVPTLTHRTANTLLSNALQLSARAEGSFNTAYEIVDDTPFARGAFAHVWRCRLRKATSGMLYVAKCIERNRLHQVDKKNLFGSEGRDGEIRLHSKIIHPNVVRLISVFEEPDVVSVVLECCAGGDLFEHIREHKRVNGGGVDLPAAAACMRQLLLALTFLHTASIVHRDVKSENVLILEEGLPLERCTCKLGDFGFAVCLHQVKDGKLYTIMGSPSTVAPEVLQKKSYGTPADLWSAGVVLFNLLAASQPFKAATPKDIMKKVKAGAYTLDGSPWNKIDEEAKDLLRSLMCTKVEARLRAPQALLHNFLHVPDRETSCASMDSARSNRGLSRFNKAKDHGSPAHVSRSVTADAIMENRASHSSASDSEFGLSERQFQELGQPAPSTRHERMPSVATDTTETSAPDSEYGVSEWQIQYARRTSTVSALGGSGGCDPSSASARGCSMLLPPYATRQSRLTSAASDTTAADSAFGLGEDQLDGTSSKEAQHQKRRHSLDPELLAKHTALEAQKELSELEGHQAALDVLGSRLQEAHPHHQSFCDTNDDQPEETEEDELEDGVELSPFIYRRRTDPRRIVDVYGKEGSWRPEGKRDIACCGCHYLPHDRPWWHRWFF
jgi:serine/threonine protein kinase